MSNVEINVPHASLDGCRVNCLTRHHFIRDAGELNDHFGDGLAGIVELGEDGTVQHAQEPTFAREVKGHNPQLDHLRLCRIQAGGFCIQVDPHLDHAAPQTFQVLVKGFMVASGVKPSRKFLSSPADNQTATVFIDKEVERRWRHYHYEMTHENGLRMVKARANLEAGGRHRIKKIGQPVLLQKPEAE